MSDEEEEASMVAALESADLERRLAALEQFLVTPRALSTKVARALVGCLGAPRKAVQRRAADALRATGAADRADVLDDLRAATRGGDSRLRWGAVFALGQLGVAETAMLPALFEAMGAADGDQRWAAAAIVASCARSHASAIAAALLEAVSSENAALRKMAIYVLRDLAPGTTDVAEAMMGALRDRDGGVRLAALSALSRLSSPPATVCDDVLRMMREDPNPGIRRAAASALGHVGRDNGAVREILMQASTSDDVGLRRAAEAARRRLDTPPRS